MAEELISLRYRQIHLDFHTSPEVPEIGADFNKARWQETLRAAAVDSITLFAKCHHGMSYHPTKVGRMHPHLDFDLLSAQFEATKEIGVNAPLYLSAGFDNCAAEAHMDWREVDKDGQFVGRAKSPLHTGYHALDFHSPYLDYLCEQIREVVRLFPDCDGIFLDIISQHQSCGPWSLKFMQANGLDPRNEADRKESSRQALEKYYEMTTAAARSGRPDMPIFHNAGHIARGRRDVLKYFSHLELESLPTGGWGYDHFPMSAKYTCNLDHDFLGMTGKFHTTWGEFGGYKHPNALRYECAAMVAFGAKCSVGDQLHPRGQLDPSTYELVGQAYREVEAKEPWCRGAEQIFDIAILSSEAEQGTSRDSPSDEGACRVFLEGHLLFGLIDREMDFNRYKALVLPDDIRIDAELKAKLDTYLSQGGKLILSGESGLEAEGDQFAFDLGVEYCGMSPYYPPSDEPSRGHDYMFPNEGLRADFLDQPQVMYERSQRIRVTDGESLGDIYDPYFNRTWEHFSSHQHTPNQAQPSGFACGVRKGNLLYFSHPVFRHYRQYGAVAYREFILKAVRMLVGEGLSLTTNLPSTARVSLTRQPGEGRYVLHLLYAPAVARGGVVSISGGNASGGRTVEVIEDLPALHDVKVSLLLPEAVRSVESFDPATQVAFETSGGKACSLNIKSFDCHAMIALK